MSEKRRRSKRNSKKKKYSKQHKLFLVPDPNRHKFCWSNIRNIIIKVYVMAITPRRKKFVAFAISFFTSRHERFGCSLCSSVSLIDMNSICKQWTKVGEDETCVHLALFFALIVCRGLCGRPVDIKVDGRLYVYLV